MQLPGTRSSWPAPGYTASVVTDFKDNLLAQHKYFQNQFRHPICMQNCIFKQIKNYLFDQNGIHWDDNNILWQVQMNFLLRVTLVKLDHNRINQFIKNGRTARE